jgi:hypothetical protein
MIAKVGGCCLFVCCCCCCFLIGFLLVCLLACLFVWLFGWLFVWSIWASFTDYYKVFDFVFQVQNPPGCTISEIFHYFSEVATETDIRDIVKYLADEGHLYPVGMLFYSILHLFFGSYLKMISITQ